MDKDHSTNIPSPELVFLSDSLTSSSVKARGTALSTLQQIFADASIPPSSCIIILKIFFRTYPLYNDRASRRAVQACIQVFLTNAFYSDCLKFFIDTFNHEASKLGIAPSNAFVLLEWGSILLEYCSKHPRIWATYGLTLVSSEAALLDLCSTSHTKEKIKHSALVVTRRGLRGVLKSGGVGSRAVEEITSRLTDKSQPLGFRSAVFLGVLAGVCARLSSSSAALKAVKAQYLTFYVRDIIGSRTIVPHHICVAFGDFFSNFATIQDIQTDIVPTFEKALLRAPEVILNGLISPLVLSLSSDLDLAQILAENFLKPLIFNMKSQNPVVRDGAISTFAVLIAHSRDERYLEKCIDDILIPLSTTKLATAEHRMLHARLLSSFPFVPSRSALMCEKLSLIASKEPNEAALAAEVSAMTTQFASLMTFEPEDILRVVDAVGVIYSQGLIDRKPAVRKVWALKVGDIFWRLKDNPTENCGVVHLNEIVAPKLLEMFHETLLNLPIAGQVDSAVVAFVSLALSNTMIDFSKTEELRSLISKARVAMRVLIPDLKSSILLNFRVYTKLSAREDFLWMIRALEATSSYLSEIGSTTPVGDAWAQAMLYLITATNVPFEIRNEALESLTRMYVNTPTPIVQTMVQGLWTWHKNIETAVTDSAAAAARTGNTKLYLAVHSICIPSSVMASYSSKVPLEALQLQMMDLLVLCRPQILPFTNWIELCLRVGQDPGSLVRSNSAQFMEKIEKCLSCFGPGYSSVSVELAVYNSAADLAFVAPDTILPLLLIRIERDLVAENVCSFRPIEVAISRAPEGIAFVDVIGKKMQNYPAGKNSPDYDTLKWEEEVRRQVAHKRGQEKKLTPDERARVATQIAKEANIRQEVKKLESCLKNAIGFITALANGPPTETIVWLGRSLKALLGVIVAGAGQIVGDAANNAYLLCSSFLSDRLGFLKKFIGLATLRSLNASHLARDLEEEPLGDLVTRLLYRLRFMSEQRPFDSVSLVYIYPLVSTVLRRGGVGLSASDESDEQVVLALEFLSFSVDTFTNIYLPREDLLNLLVDSMQSFSQHYKVIKECILNFCRCLGPNITTKETAILLKGAIVPQTSVRTTILQAIKDSIDLTDLEFCEEIWLACYDNVEENAALGQAIWEENALECESQDAFKMLPYLSSTDKQLRRAASNAMAQCIHDSPSVFADVLTRLEESYRELAKLRLPQTDEFGMPRKSNLADQWEARSGIALAFNALAPVFDSSKLIGFVKFLIHDNALGDRSSSVRDEMIESAIAIIARHGADNVEELMSIFEAALDESDQSSKVSDLVNEAIVILYGSLASHLQPNDRRVPKVVKRLLQTLSTPSETVQYAVAGCLISLIRNSDQNINEYVKATLEQLLRSKSYASRRGAAYGLAGIISGKGISALQEFRLLSTLKVALENKKDQNQRQGALFAYELLSLLLGRTFEPYIIQIVPQLLSSFGDPTADVREACLDTSKTCFASLSSYGVKVILPRLLEGLEEQQWRSKKGACDLLGAMAYLDPQQLALSLPEIIPPLTNVLNDSHKEVRASANRSLQRFGEVISNPEIKGVVTILLKSLSDPTKYTEEALDALIKVSFVHYLDAPSLALIVRILERGLSDRSGTKRKSAQIIGSLAHLTERKDVISHLPILVAGLRTAAIDPVPATRATASKALGSLVEKLGEDALPDLIPSLMSTLKSDTGAGDRLGSAQALSEVLAGLGTGRLEETLPTILQNVASPRPAVREGFMSLFIYLPACFGNSFVVHLSKIIPPILSGLADDIESIRETSLRAGRLLVKNFATKAIDLLLPELDRGLADDNHRIRLSSVDLVGHLLFNLTGISGKTEQDEEEGAAEAGKSLLEVLGEDKRNRILSSLYICRCDTSGLVRNAAINVWKALVATPKTLKELVPTLTQLLIRRLASSNMEQREIAGNALGELIRKAGDGVLASLLPTLEEGLQTSTDTDHKQGICIALREIISSASQDILEDYEQTLISVVRVALVDIDDNVREAAAEAFDSLQKFYGKKAIDQVLPYLLNLLRTENEADTALSALLTLLNDNTRSNIILPNLLPTLLTSPLTAFNAKAVASLSQVAGPALNRRLPAVLNTLVDSVVNCEESELRVDIESALDTILLSVDEFDGLNIVMGVMLTLSKHNEHKKRAISNASLSRFFSKSTLDYSRYHQDLFRVLLIAFNDSDEAVVKAAWLALSELTKHLRKEEMETLVLPARQVLQQAGVSGVNLPGFELPKGISAVLPIFLQGLMNGTAEQRTNAALAISEIVDRTSADALKPFVTQITGPLIRVVSERAVEVKSAILFTLNNLLGKIPTFLKPFLPQLQRTFAKSLADTSSEVLRSRAARALGTLITLTPRVDPLIAELVIGSKTPDLGVHNAMLQALYEVVSKAGENMSETSRTSVLSIIDSESDNADDAAAATNARLFGALIKTFPSPGATGLIKQRVFSPKLSVSSSLNLNSILLGSPKLLESFSQDTVAMICQGIGSKNTVVSENSVLAAGKYLLSRESNHVIDTEKTVLKALVTAMQPGGPVDSRRLALVVIRTISRCQYHVVAPHLGLLAPSVFAGVRDPVIPVKLAAEAAFLSIFLVEDAESEVFDKFIADAEPELSPNLERSMQDYFKRIALRLGAQARERKEAEGGQGGLGLSNDERDDENEVWSIGKVGLGQEVFSDE